MAERGLCSNCDQQGIPSAKRSAVWTIGREVCVRCGEELARQVVEGLPAPGELLEVPSPSEHVCAPRPPAQSARPLPPVEAPWIDEEPDMDDWDALEYWPGPVVGRARPCWGCDSTLEPGSNPRCPECGWLICPSGHCSKPSANPGVRCT